MNSSDVRSLSIAVALILGLGMLGATVFVFGYLNQQVEDGAMAYLDDIESLPPEEQLERHLDMMQRFAEATGDPEAKKDIEAFRQELKAYEDMPNWEDDDPYLRAEWEARVREAEQRARANQPDAAPTVPVNRRVQPESSGPNPVLIAGAGGLCVLAVGMMGALAILFMGGRDEDDEAA